jgi:hypothetical protein
MNGLGDAVLPREEDEAFGVDEVLGKDSGAAAGAAAADSQKTALTVRAHTQTGQTESAPRIPINPSSTYWIEATVRTVAVVR